MSHLFYSIIVLLSWKLVVLGLDLDTLPCPGAHMPEKQVVQETPCPLGLSFPSVTQSAKERGGTSLYCGTAVLDKPKPCSGPTNCTAKLALGAAPPKLLHIPQNLEALGTLKVNLGKDASQMWQLCPSAGLSFLCTTRVTTCPGASSLLLHSQAGGPWHLLLQAVHVPASPTSHSP